MVNKVLISKTLNLGKDDFINKLVGIVTINKKATDEFFHLGYPLINPPLIRGTIIVNFNLSFMFDNIKSFNYASPVDTGSIKHGFIKTKVAKDSFLDKIVCDYDKFKSLCLDLMAEPKYSVDKLSRHIACLGLYKTLSKYFDEDVLSVMYEETNPHAWLFEFSLHNDFLLEKHHVSKIHIPNTYINSNNFDKIKDIYKDKVISYNPKYGIESIIYD